MSNKTNLLLFISLFTFSISTVFSQSDTLHPASSQKKHLEICGSCKKKPWLCDIYKKNIQVFSVIPLFSGFTIDGIRRFNYGVGVGYGYYIKEKLLISMLHSPYITLDNKYQYMFTFDNNIKIRKYFSECRTNFFVQAGIGNTLFNYNPVPGYLFMHDEPNSGRVTHNQFYVFPGAGVSFKIKKKYSFDFFVDYNIKITNPGRGRIVPLSFHILFNFHNFKYVANHP